MKKARLKENTTKKSNKSSITDERFSPKVAVVTGIIMLASLVGFYFLTDKLVKNRKNTNETQEKEMTSVRESNSINYSDIDKIEDKNYYLLLDAGTKVEETSNKEDSKSNKDSNSNEQKTINYASEYDQHIDYIAYQKLVDEKFYYIDYTKEENKDVFDKKEKLKNLKKLKVKEPTLIYVKDGKIDTTYVGNNNILMQMYIIRGYITTKSYSDSNSNKETKSNSNSKSNKESKSNSNKK